MNAIHCLIIVSMFAMIQHGACDSKCKPIEKVQPGKKVTIEYLFEAIEKSPDVISNTLCLIYEDFKDFIVIKYRMGSQVKMDGKNMSCAESGCYGDRLKACQYQLIKPNRYNSVTPCGYLPDVNDNEVNDCIEKKQADKILIENGKKRIKYGIPDGLNGVLAFNGTYYPCVDVSSSEALSKFLCLMYNNEIKPCK